MDTANAKLQTISEHGGKESDVAICDACGNTTGLDVEKTVAATQSEEAKKNIVTWDGPNDPDNPKNIPSIRK